MRDKWPWGSAVPPAAFYRYSADRKGVHARALLGCCCGFLHADGYAGFDALHAPTTVAGDPPLIEVACWSHARREHVQPLLDQIRAFLDTSLGRISGKGTLAQAIRYALSRWAALGRYTTAGRLEMSNNTAERAIRPLVLGRKNYLFCGSDAVGQRAACIYTLAESTMMNGINPRPT